MAIFGYICLVLICLWLTSIFFGAFWLEVGFTGKVTGFTITWGAVTAVAWYFLYQLFPFAVHLK